MLELFDTQADPGMLVVALVAFGAGLIRGFTGFGGPAFMLAILTLFFPPVGVISKILVADFVANIYLMKSCYRDIRWKKTAYMVVPTLLVMPIGHWVLLQMDPVIMKRIIAFIIASVSLLMLAGFRYRHEMTVPWLITGGVIGGFVFGGTYVALLTVAFILLGPYDKHQGRTLIIAWTFFTVLGFAIISFSFGSTQLTDIWVAAPGAVTYLLGSWMGSKGFHLASEKLFRRLALSTLLILSLFSLIN